MKYRHLSSIALLLITSFMAPGIASAQCKAPAAWFPHEKTPRPNDSDDFNTNCKFHLWSWQMFLWLTQKTGPNGELRFETMPTPEEMFEVTESGMPMALSARKAPSVLRLAPRTMNKAMVQGSPLNAIKQAGSFGLLVDQNGRIVYFSQYVNDIYFNFVRSNEFYIPENYKDAPDDQNYPIGTLELKAAWKVLGEGESGDGLYVRTAEINLLEEKDGELVVSAEVRQEDVALVGLHVVGVVKNHPEFIWATFEAARNAPDLGEGIAPGGDEPVSADDWLFYTKDTPAVECNQNSAGVATLVDAGKQLVAPVTQVYLRHPQGNGAPSNIAEIKDLNQSVKNQLADDSVAKNYYLGGATWLKPNSLEPDLSLNGKQKLVVGSTELSNSVMETFTQQEGFRNNCFKCHNTKMVFAPSGITGVDPIPPKNMNISHAMTDGYFRNAAKEREADIAGARATMVQDFIKRIKSK
ncbi:hypothetical protein [Haloferula sp.]|uniref:hypothetical protein n=1 Tax=Haloferula sp. TaxID=2497595 RepID=UPI00329F8AB7